VDRLKDAVESIEMGPTEDAKNTVGCVIDGEARSKIHDAIETAREEGDILLERLNHGACGYAVPLTVVEGIQPGHRTAQEEIFGPVLALMKVLSFDEALAVANKSSYALTGAVFSRSPVNIARAFREFRVGNLYVNRQCTGAVVGRNPFGGFKLSGVGSKAGGPDYLHQFMVPRTVTENTFRRGFAPSKSSV
jgi:RHH-type proline utilization regulon transcriptional repressor/proline dehydrogenase/delta 1-pyrroline-5-carboxylate dehydrogenase